MMWIVLVVGIPGSGKSSFLDSLQTSPRWFDSDGILTASKKLATVQFDKIFHDLQDAHDDFDVGLWHLHRQEALNCVLAIAQSWLNAPEVQDGVLFVEDNGYYRSMRRPFFRLARQLGMKYHVIHLDVDVTTALSRNATREPPHRVADDTVLRMAANFESPRKKQITKEEEEVILPVESKKDTSLTSKVHKPTGFTQWENRAFVLSTRNNDSNDAFNDEYWINHFPWQQWYALCADQDFLMPPPHTIPPAQTQSFAHSLDLKLRKQVSASVQAVRAESKNDAMKIKHVVKRANQLRKKLLDDAKATHGLWTDTDTADDHLQALVHQFKRDMSVSTEPN